MIKICGIKTPEDVPAVSQCRPDAVGFVFAKSPREVSMEEAKHMISMLPPGIQSFGVFVDPEEEVLERAIRWAGVDIVQLHGDEPIDIVKKFRQRVVKAIRIKKGDDINRFKYYEPYVRGFIVDAWCEDLYGGTGRTVDRVLARECVTFFDRPVILAGGLNPSNLTEIVKEIRPYGVDVSSGVEASLGKKDPGLVAQFVACARQLGL